MEEIKSYFRGVDRKSAIIYVSSLVLMTVYVYQGNHNFFAQHLSQSIGGEERLAEYRHVYQFFSAFFFFLVIPALIIKLYFKESLKDYGFALGDWKFGLKVVLIFIPIMAPMLYINSMQADFQAEYPLFKGAGASVFSYITWEMKYLVYYIAWEFFFRGYMQMGLKDSMGAFWSIMAQTVPSTLIHIGKPEGETMSAIIAGIAFGAVALRTRSVLFLILFHFYVGAVTDLFCLINSG